MGSILWRLQGIYCLTSSASGWWPVSTIFLSLAMAGRSWRDPGWTEKSGKSVQETKTKNHCFSPLFPFERHMTFNVMRENKKDNPWTVEICPSRFALAFGCSRFYKQTSNFPQLRLSSLQAKNFTVCFGFSKHKIFNLCLPVNTNIFLCVFSANIQIESFGQMFLHSASSWTVLVEAWSV